MVVNKKGQSDTTTKAAQLIYKIDPTECPFREFRDNELGVDYWGMGPAAFRAAIHLGKAMAKPTADHVWIDDQTQPLPRSIRNFLHGWVRAETLAAERYKSDVVIFEDNEHTRMDMTSMQLGHAQVLRRSSFCRTVFSICFAMERAEGLMPEFQWENFVFQFAEGWLPRYHIYAPGMRNGGGSQHRPYLSRSGCYLVRLYHLGVWRCVWVNDTVPVDASGAPLLPFSPLITPIHTKHPSTGARHAMNMVSHVVQLWPLLLCKAKYKTISLLTNLPQAILKLFAPDMSADYDLDSDEAVEDEEIEDFDISHCLTGSMRLRTKISGEAVWDLLFKEVPLFSWDDDNETTLSTTKTRSTKKPVTKEINVPRQRRSSFTVIKIQDTAEVPPYILPGISPGFQMDLLVTQIRDLPLKKPLPEPGIFYQALEWAEKIKFQNLFNRPIFNTS